MPLFNECLKQIRLKNNCTQSAVANYLGISDRAYQNYEYGNREPNIDNLIKIADYFNVSLDYLVGRTDKPEVNK